MQQCKNAWRYKGFINLLLAVLWSADFPDWAWHQREEGH
jgi:hypothetical protein